MAQGRRTFLKHAGVAGALATIGGGITSPAAPLAVPRRTLGRGMARGLKLLTMRRQGKDRLA